MVQVSLTHMKSLNHCLEPFISFPLPKLFVHILIGKSSTANRLLEMFYSDPIARPLPFHVNLAQTTEGSFNFESRKLTTLITLYDTNGLIDLNTPANKLADNFKPALEGRQLIGKPLGTASWGVSEHGRIDCFLLVHKIPSSSNGREVRQSSSQQQCYLVSITNDLMNLVE